MLPRTTRHGSAAGSPHAPWLVSLVMWSNCMQFVGEEGVPVRELERRARTTTNLAGMQRWGYIARLGWRRGGFRRFSDTKFRRATRICWPKIVFYPLDPLRGKGGQLARIEAPKNGGWACALSPDGSSLALVENKDRIEMLNLLERAWHEVSLAGWGVLQGIAWSPDGKGFFLTSVLPEAWVLLHVTPAGRVSLLLRNPRSQTLSTPLPSPNGKHLAFQAETYDSNVWMIENF